MRSALLVVIVGLAGCGGTEATIAPTLAPCVMPAIEETMCLQVTDDGGPTRLASRSSFLYFSYDWGNTYAIEYEEANDDEWLNCQPTSRECQAVESSEIIDRLADGSRVTIDFPDTAAARSWLAPAGVGLLMGGTPVVATEALAAQALTLDADPVAYRLELVIRVETPLELVAVTSL